MATNVNFKGHCYYLEQGEWFTSFQKKGKHLEQKFLIECQTWAWKYRI
jgi:hypothetical protein